MKQKITADAKKTLERAIEVLEQTDLDENMDQGVKISESSLCAGSEKV